MRFMLALAEDEVPSTGEHDPYMHVFLDAGAGNVLAAKAHAESRGLKVLGPTDHGIFTSIYFVDPNDHRVELAVDTARQADRDELERAAPLMLEEWSRTKLAPRHAAWLHKRARDAHTTKNATT